MEEEIDWSFLQDDSYSRSVKTKDRNYNVTPLEKEAYLKAADDPIFFIENMVRIIGANGEIPFKLFNFQRDMVDAYIGKRNIISLLPRQMGKTEVSAAFILWYMLFNENKKVLVAANKFEQVQMIIERIRFSFTSVPDKLKPALIEDNARRLKFSNGSSVQGVATTKDSGRGKSIHLLYIDEMAFIPANIAKEFWASVKPVISNGGKCIITSTPLVDDDEFATMWFDANNIFDEFGAERPNRLGKNDFFAYRADWWERPGRDEAWAASERSSIGQIRWEREYECKFVGFDETLIPSAVLQRMSGIEEKFTTGQVRWFDKPKPNKTYAIGMDLGSGIGKDYSTIQVLQLPEMIQIAEWRSNKTIMSGQVKTLHNILKIIDAEMRNNVSQRQEPEIYWSFEANGGYGDHCWEIIDQIGLDNFPGELINEPTNARNTARRRRGLWTTNRTKLKCCSQIQGFLSGNKIIINSKALIGEFKSFVADGSGYRAKGGETDDLIMGLFCCLRVIDHIKNFDEELMDALSMDDGDGENYIPMPVMVIR